MEIGIDLDNTIISYDKSFAIVGKVLGLIPVEWYGSKLEVRDYLRNSLDGETKWQRLQGKVYGRYLHLSELYAGVYRFLWRCKRKGFSIDIVSHKTEFGHYDEEKISLRKAAIDFLKNSGLYLENNKESIVRNIYFHNTKEEKVERINKENYFYFIDDLTEILKHSLLNNDTRKILFDPNLAYSKFPEERIEIATTWAEIEDFIFGNYLQEDLDFFRQEFSLPVFKNSFWLEGQGNSRIACLETMDSKKYALKLYPSDSNHNRLNSEFFGFKLLHENSIKCVPKAISCNPQLNCAIYEWVDGSKIEQPSKMELDSMLQIIEKLHGLTNSELPLEIGRASASCFSGLDIETQIQTRLKLLYPASESHQQLKKFLEEDLIPFKDFLIEWVKNNWGEEDNYNLPMSKKFLTLSPSDFGFHNMLKNKDGEITFLDFEYFGWDDPVKLIVDVSFHPAMNLSEEERTYWQEGTFTIFGESLKKRYNLTWAMYAFCWCLILLNEFRKDIWARRILANSSKQNNRSEILEKQLNKSICMFQIIQSNFHKQIRKG
jgi:thiamine kinase-like enzyme